MIKFWSLDSPVMNGLSTIADIVILNLIYVVCCIPIVTIGAANAALYTVTMKMARKEAPAVLKIFFKALKNNIKTATIVWLFQLTIAGLMLFDLRLIGAFGSVAGAVTKVLLGAVLIVFLIIREYLFPYIARFENTVMATFKNAMMLSVAHAPYTLVMAGMTVGVTVIALFTGRTFTISMLFFVFFGFALLAYVKSFLLVKVFKQYEEDCE